MPDFNLESDRPVTFADLLLGGIVNTDREYLVIMLDQISHTPDKELKDTVVRTLKESIDLRYKLDEE